MPAWPASVPSPPPTALEHLRVLVDLHARGLREPLPLYCKTSAAYASAPRVRRERDARREWETDRRWDHEDREREHLLVLGGQVPFDELLYARPARRRGRRRLGRPTSRRASGATPAGCGTGCSPTRSWTDL